MALFERIAEARGAQLPGREVLLGTTKPAPMTPASVCSPWRRASRSARPTATPCWRRRRRPIDWPRSARPWTRLPRWWNSSCRNKARRPRRLPTVKGRAHLGRGTRPGTGGCCGNHHQTVGASTRARGWLVQGFASVRRHVVGDRDDVRCRPRIRDIPRAAGLPAGAASVERGSRRHQRTRVRRCGVRAADA